MYVLCEACIVLPPNTGIDCFLVRITDILIPVCVTYLPALGYQLISLGQV